jgi:hypothetical protein
MKMPMITTMRRAGVIQILDKFPMLKEMFMKTVVTFLVSLAFLMMPCGLFAQQEKTEAPAAQEQGQKGAPCPEMMAHHGKMKVEHEEMMKEMDARLAAKVAAMDAAKGDKKLEAMAAVIKEMVSQRKEMREHMMRMGKRWMEHKKAHKAKGESEESGVGKGKGM